MTSRKPARNQWKFDWDADPKRKRGQQLKMLRNVRLGCLKLRALLRELDDRIPNHTEARPETFALSMATLVDELEISRSEAYELCDRLRDLGVLAWDDLANGKREFWICWGTLSEFAHPDPAQRPETPSLQQFRQRRKPIRSKASNDGDQEPAIPHRRNTINSAPAEDHSAPAELESSPAEDHSAPAELHIRNIATLSQSSPSSKGTPSADGGGDRDGFDREAVTKLVRKAGVARAAEKVRQALAAGMSLRQIADVARHALQFPGRWSGGIVADRLTQADAPSLSAAEGWFGDDPKWLERERERKAAERRAAPERESIESRLEHEFGFQLDTTSDEDLAEVIARLDQYQRPRADRLIALGHNLRRTTMRADLLAALARMQHATTDTS